MGKEVENILQELYEIDENLQKKEPELKKIIHSMLNLRPNITIDENFKYSLREQIQQKINSEKLHNFQKSQKNNFWTIFAYTFWTLGTLAFWFFIWGEMFMNKNIPLDTSLQMEQSKLLSFDSSITESKNGFWNLKWLWVDYSAKWGVTEKMSLQATNMVEDIMVESSNLMDTQTEKSNVMPLLWDTISEKIMLPTEPEWTPEVYRYNFSWAINILIPDNLPVYKKSTSNNVWKTFAENVANFTFNWLDVSRFSDLSAGNISLNQDKEYGYSINIDFSNGYLNIYKNWDKWPQATDESKKTVLLSDSEILKITNDFLKDYNIDVSKYGWAKIDSNYLQIMETYSRSKKMPDYVTNTTSVVYPLLVDGKEVMEESWWLSGLRVEIDLTEKKVTSLQWLSVTNYLKAEYNIERNTDNILKIANVGWRFGLDAQKYENAKYIDITLKNPKLQYIRTYNYSNNWQEEFLIPAIIFETEKSENGNYYWTTVTVPLIKDFYNYDANGKIIWNSQE